MYRAMSAAKVDMAYYLPLMPTRKTIILPLELASIKEEGYHVFIELLVSGKPVRMLLDTGASRTVFDIETLQKLHADIELEMNEDPATGLGSNAVENFIAIIGELKIGELSIKDYQVGVLNLSHVNESYSRIGLSPIAGVMGSDILVKYGAVISFEDNTLRLNF